MEGSVIKLTNKIKKEYYIEQASAEAISLIGEITEQSESQVIEMLLKKFYMDFKEYSEYKRLNKKASVRKLQEMSDIEDLK